MANPTYKPSEGKREEFRKYLEKNGVLDCLTKVLVNLYEEVDKPEDALEYIRDKLAFQAGVATLKQMQSKVDELQDRVKELEGQLEEAAKQQTVETVVMPDVPGEVEVEQVVAIEDAPTEAVAAVEAAPFASAEAAEVPRTEN